MTRFFDILFSLVGLVILFPLLIVIYLMVVLESRGGGFYVQKRVGRNGKDFKLYKFRSMHIGADKKGMITVGETDPRMTNVGVFIRHFKLDELPQLLNVLRGDMSLVGPRPELKFYVDIYTSEQRKVLTVRPGITDYASIEYLDENRILGSSVDPQRAYIEEIMPHKIRLNMKYIERQSLKEYFKVIFLTFSQIVKRRNIVDNGE